MSAPPPQPFQPSNFIYPSRTLDADRREIRVLRLHPGEYGSEISCSLEIASLNQYTRRRYLLKGHGLPDLQGHSRDQQSLQSAEEDYREAVRQHGMPDCRSCHSRGRLTRTNQTHYGSWPVDCDKILEVPDCGTKLCQCFEAVSYVWGLSNEGRSIILGGLAGFQVTDNLLRALQRLRYASRDRVLWVDAICINQQDLGERATQVGFMSTIYRTCWNLVVWLGDTAIEPTQNAWALTSEAARSTLEPGMIMRARHECALALSDTIKNTCSMWWDRMWTLPEALAYGFDPGPAMVMGAFELTWCAFLDVLEGVKDFEHIAGRVRGLVNIHGSRTKGVSILAMHLSAAVRLCHDPRDYVFALLGVIDEAEAKQLTPNYGPAYTASKLFMDTTRAVLRVQGPYNTLCHVDLQCTGDIDLPTWAINFAQPPPRSVGPPLPAFLPKFDNGVSHHDQLCAGANERHLRLRAFELDTVHACVRIPYKIHPDGAQDDKSIELAVDNLVHQLPMHFPYCLLARQKARPSGRPAQCIGGCRGDLDVPALCKYIRDESAVPALLERPYSHRKAFALFGAWCATWNVPRQSFEDDILYFFRPSERVSALFVTEAGFVGITDARLEVGDTIAYFSDSNTPAVLSVSRANPSCHCLRGFVHYLCGFFNEEYQQFLPDLRIEAKDFVLC